MSNADHAAERRRERRWNLRIPLRVFDQETNIVLGHVVDIATKGMQIVSEQPIEREKNYRLLLEIVTETGQWKTVPIKALSVWTSQSGEKQFRAGLHIFSMATESRQEIKRFLDNLQTQSSKS